MSARFWDSTRLLVMPPRAAVNPASQEQTSSRARHDPPSGHARYGGSPVKIIRLLLLFVPLAVALVRRGRQR